MKIRVSDIPAAGLKINDSIPLESINERMSNGRGQDIKFVSAPKVELLAEKTASGAQVSGHVRSRVSQECARCCERIERDLDIPIDLQLAARAAPGEEREDAEFVSDDESAGDIGVVFFDGDHVDLEDVLNESLILGLSLYWSPTCDNQGRCTLCFKHRDQFGKSSGAKPGTSLGALLKKVGVN
ncbi:MAG: DUF177 domain-containing protein [Oligoflexia bacterium]|nr:DUF177 domain-containing protein [Oligoflexia bacterium]